MKYITPRTALSRRLTPVSFRVLTAVAAFLAGPVFVGLASDRNGQDAVDVLPAAAVTNVWGHYRSAVPSLKRVFDSANRLWSLGLEGGSTTP